MKDFKYEPSQEKAYSNNHITVIISPTIKKCVCSSKYNKEYFNLLKKTLKIIYLNYLLRRLEESPVETMVEQKIMQKFSIENGISDFIINLCNPCDVICLILL